MHDSQLQQSCTKKYGYTYIQSNIIYSSFKSCLCHDNKRVLVPPIWNFAQHSQGIHHKMFSSLIIFLKPQTFTCSLSHWFILKNEPHFSLYQQVVWYSGISLWPHLCIHLSTCRQCCPHFISSTRHQVQFCITKEASQNVYIIGMFCYYRVMPPFGHQM